MSDLREKAEKATQGEWLLHTDTVVGLKIPQYARGEDWIIAETFGAGADIDAAYIAAVHPQAVIALLDERDALAARVEELEGAAVWNTDMDAAPKDGTRVLLSDGKRAEQGYYLDNSKSIKPWSGWRVESMRLSLTPTAWKTITPHEGG